MTAESREPAGLGSAGLDHELHRLGDQITALVGLPYVIGEPGDDHQGRCITLQVVRLAAQPYRAEMGMARINAEVLIEARGGEHGADADAVATVMLRLLADGGRTLLAGQPDADVWAGLGRTARPAFMIALPVSLSIVRRKVPPVRYPLKVDDLGARRARGRVLAADGTPLAGAIVRLRPDGVAVTADHAGRWTLLLPNVLVHLEVSARGSETTYDLPPDPGLLPGAFGEEKTMIDIVLADVGASSAGHSRPPPKAS
jgi:hypothetical protein